MKDKYDIEIERILDTPRYNGEHSQFLKSIEYATQHIGVEGLWLEFGVANGTSINWLATLTPNLIYGFDSFYGLHEEWNGKEIGEFSTNGIPPKVNDNVRLIQGMFEDTLPKFIQKHEPPCAFLHIDSDLYSSCKIIFKYLYNYIVPDTVIAFDEICNGESDNNCTYFDYKDHELKAWLEFVEDYSVEYQWLCHAYTRSNAAVLIKNIDHNYKK